MEEGGNGEGGDEDDNDDSDSEGEDGVIVTIDQKRIEEDKTKTIQSMQVNPGLYIFLYWRNLFKTNVIRSNRVKEKVVSTSPKSREPLLLRWFKIMWSLKSHDCLFARILTQ